MMCAVPCGRLFARVNFSDGQRGAVGAGRPRARGTSRAWQDRPPGRSPRCPPALCPAGERSRSRPRRSRSDGDRPRRWRPWRERRQGGGGGERSAAFHLRVSRVLATRGIRLDSLILSAESYRAPALRAGFGPRGRIGTSANLHIFICLSSSWARSGRFWKRRAHADRPVGCPDLPPSAQSRASCGRLATPQERTCKGGVRRQSTRVVPMGRVEEEQAR